MRSFRLNSAISVTPKPLHASIQEHCRAIGFDNLAPIFWYKIANAKHEVENGSSGFLGKPYEPNAVVKNDVEYILMQRKYGAFRIRTAKRLYKRLVVNRTAGLRRQFVGNELRCILPVVVLLGGKIGLNPRCAFIQST